MESPILYLALPWKNNPTRSFTNSVSWTCILRMTGNYVFSPILHTHPYWKFLKKGADKENAPNEINEYLKTYFQQAEHYELLGRELIKDPITSIDYLKRSYLMTGESNTKNKINKIISNLSSPEYFTKEIQKNIKNLITS